MKKLNKMITGLCAVLIGATLLAGCEKDAAWEKWTTNQMSVEKDGKVICCVVESFDKNYYDVGELTGMAVQEAADFNGKNKVNESTPATVLDVSRLETDQNMVRVVYQFDKARSYGAFQGKTLYYETLDDAIRQKHVFTGAMLYNSDGSIALDDENKNKYREKHVMITDAKTVIHLPYEVLYYGPGVKLLNDGSIDTTACEDMAVVILKK